VHVLDYGDHLHALREHIKDESVDLITLSLPFHSQAHYPVLLRAPTDEQSQAQIAAFGPSLTVDGTWKYT
jgi:site-specific DNA-methyltransferase (adenine-specific)